MGNACCCDCSVDQGRRGGAPNFHNSRNIPHNRDLLGGKGTGQRIYNKYQPKARAPIPYAGYKQTNDLRGRDNPAYNGQRRSPPPVHRTRRRPGPKPSGHSRVARVHQNHATNTSSSNNSRRSTENRSIHSQHDLNVRSLGVDNEAFESCFSPGQIRATVIGVASTDAADVNHNTPNRSYSIATTVSLGQRADKYSASVALVRVEAFGHSWLLHKTGLDFENFIVDIKEKVTPAERVLVLQEGQEVTLQELSNFLLFVLTRDHLLNDRSTLKFFELNKVAHLPSNNEAAEVSSSTTADISTSSTSESDYSVSDTSESSAARQQNEDSNNSSTNTINLSYEASNDQLIVDRQAREVLASGQRSRTSSRASHFTTQSFNLRRSDRSNGVVTHQPLSRNDGSVTPLPIPIITTTPCPTEVSPSPPPSLSRMFLLAPPLPSATPPPPYDFEVEKDIRAKTTFQITSSKPRSASKASSMAETVEIPVGDCDNGRPKSPDVTGQDRRNITETDARAVTPVVPEEVRAAARARRERHTSINLDNLDGPQETMSPSDFEFLGVIGKGSFGQVLLARHLATNKPYAVKMLSKRVISRRKETQHVLSERSVLIKVLHHPYLVQLHYAFTTRHKIFFVLDFVNGGELFFHLQRERVFSEPRAMFYAAEICCALTYMHTKEIVYRDLKPENLLLDKEGHVVLTDFGLCKEGINNSSSRTGTFCGTPEYLAPEILLKKPYTRVVDWWTLGAVLYEMLYGLPPFYSSNQMAMYEAIISKPLKLKHGPSVRARNLLSALLKKKPEDRLGFGPEDGQAVKDHEFFRSIDWEAVEQRKLKPPFVPKVTSDTDTRNIDPSFTREPVRLGSVCPAPQQDSAGAESNPFKGFSYARPLSDTNEDDEEDLEEPDR